MIWLHLAPLILFLWCAYCDHKTQTIPGIYSALLWMYIAIVFQQGTQMAILFGVLWLLATISEKISKTKDSELGWGDVLIFPSFWGVVLALSQINPFIMPISVFIGIVPLIVSRHLMKKVPLVPALAIGYAVGLGIALLTPV